MTTSSYDREAYKRVKQENARNEARLAERFSKQSATARRDFAVRQQFLRQRALGA